jgi:hypothetical protein
MTELESFLERRRRRDEEYAKERAADLVRQVEVAKGVLRADEWKRVESYAGTLRIGCAQLSEPQCHALAVDWVVTRMGWDEWIRRSNSAMGSVAPQLSAEPAPVPAPEKQQSAPVVAPEEPLTAPVPAPVEPQSDAEPDTWKTLAEWHAYREWLVSGAARRLCIRMDPRRRWVWLTHDPVVGGLFAGGPHQLYTDPLGTTRVSPLHDSSVEAQAAVRLVMDEVAKISGGGVLIVRSPPR